MQLVIINFLGLKYFPFGNQYLSIQFNSMQSNLTHRYAYPGILTVPFNHISSYIFHTIIKLKKLLYESRTIAFSS